MAQAIFKAVTKRSDEEKRRIVRRIEALVEDGGMSVARAAKRCQTTTQTYYELRKLYASQEPGTRNQELRTAPPNARA